MAPQFIRDRIWLQIADGIADIRLCRKERMNALDRAMFDALADVIALLGENEARVAVLSGDGKAFCVGLDKAMFSQMLRGDLVNGNPADLTSRTPWIANLPQHIVSGWRDLPTPVIAAVHGVAFGGGLQLALGADLRVAALDTRFSLMEIRWGLVPDIGAMALLPKLVRDDILRDLLFTGREFLANEAVELGIATHVAEDPRASAMVIARSILTVSPSAMSAAKRLANLAYLDRDAALLRAESEKQQNLIGHRGQLEVVGAALADRPPNFVSPS